MRQALFGSFFLLAVTATVPAQVPTLVPSQTVNPATGEMGFSLPLGVVKGTNGHNFPLTLNYGAGIRVGQEAGPAGLGFGYGPGGITRSVVLVPDETVGGSANFNYGHHDECSAPLWVQVFAPVAMCASLLVAIATGGAATPLAFAVGALSAGFSAYESYLTSELQTACSDMRAGGTHTPQYDWQNGNGAGFFNVGNDLPDVYFVNTPFVSGQLVWIGNAATGKFCFKQTGGVASKEVVYDRSNNTFQITLSDGTRLLFDEQTEWPIHHYDLGWLDADGGGACAWQTETHLREAITQQWHLTKVLFNDYVDGDGDSNDPLPLNPSKPNKGSWLRFVYRALERSDIYKRTATTQVTPRTNWRVTTFGFGGQTSEPFYHNDRLPVDYGTTGSVRICNLSSIESPNERAVFNYVDSRTDNIWRSQSSAQIVKMPLLESFDVYAATGQKRASISLQTAYELLPGSGVPFDQADPDATPGSLTLKSLIISDQSGQCLPPVLFAYAKNVDLNPPRKLPDNAYWIEQKDLWGYYRARPSGDNEWNGAGLYSGDADAWSLTGLTLPTGMKIRWEYEPNRYDAVNNISVSSSTTMKEPKYSGGIRVKKLTVDDGLGKSTSTMSRWYFYTDKAGQFVEKADPARGGQWFCSGHATVEPYNYVGSSDYRTNPATRGGLYTPAKVGYELVQVVDNYMPNADPARNGTAPQGYTAYSFVTSADPGCQNEGTYGDVDNSYKRGMLRRVTTYNSQGRVVTSATNTYDVKVDHLLEPIVSFTGTGEMTRITETPFLRTGTVRLESATKTVDGVTSVSENDYADEPGISGDVARVNVFRTAGVLAPSTAEMSCPLQRVSKGKSCLTTLLGASTILPDLAIVAKWHCNNGVTNEVRMRVCSDMTFAEGQQPTGTWSNSTVLFSGQDAEKMDLGGLAFTNTNADPRPDLIIAYHNRGSITYFFRVFPDLQITGGALTWGTPFEKSFSATDARKALAWSNCAFLDRDKDGKVDRAVFTGHPESDGPYDIGSTVWICDLGTTADVVAQYLAPSVIAPDFLQYNGSSIAMFDYDKDGQEDDLVITYSDPYSILGNTHQQQIRKQIYFDVNISGGQVHAGSPAGTCLVVGKSLVLQNTTIDDITFVDNAYASDGAEYNVFEQGSALRIVQVNPSVNRDLNGIPDRTALTNSDSRKRVVISTPAFLKYPGMGVGNKHMLTQMCQTATYDGGASTTPQVDNGRAVAASATSWKDWGNGRYLPDESFVWNVDMGPTGLPKTGKELTPFVFPAPTYPAALPAGWMRTGKVTGVDNSSQVTEAVKNPGVANAELYSSTVYGHNGLFPIASVTNANALECAAFTCDFDDGTDPGYFDKDKRWGHGEGNEIGLSGAKVELVGPPTASHFGEKCVRTVNAYGPTANVRLTKGRDYILSAWVKVVSGNLVLGGDYRFKIKATDVTLPITSFDGPLVGFSVAAQNPGVCDWKLVELRIPAGADLAAKDWTNTNWYARVFVGTPNGGEAYIDDIRFYPANALMSTTYYTKPLMAPIASVDANGRGRKVVYDGFGRMTAAYNTKGQKVKEYNYHLRDELLPGEDIRLNYPTGGEVFPVGSLVTIRWINSVTGTVTLSYQSADGTGNQTITSVANQQGYGIYDWPVPVGALGNRVIKIVNSANGHSSVSGGFTITAPGAPSSPTPANGSTLHALNLQLQWTGGASGGQPLTYTVYFGESNPPTQVAGTTTQTMFDVSGLSFGKTYYWKVSASDGYSSVDGPVWSFSIVNHTPPAPSAGSVSVVNGSFVYTWNCGPDPDGDALHYRVVIRVGCPGSLLPPCHPTPVVATWVDVTGQDAINRRITLPAVIYSQSCCIGRWKIKSVDEHGAESGLAPAPDPDEGWSLPGP